MLQCAVARIVGINKTESFGADLDDLALFSLFAVNGAAHIYPRAEEGEICCIVLALSIAASKQASFVNSRARRFRVDKMHSGDCDIGVVES